MVKQVITASDRFEYHLVTLLVLGLQAANYGGGCYTIPAKVVKVYDADTVHLSGPFGLDGEMVTTSVRIGGVWAHEVDGGTKETKRRGLAAAEFVRKRLKPGDDVIFVWPYNLKRRHDQNMTLSRPVGYVYHNGQSITDLVCDAGLAHRDEKKHKAEKRRLIAEGNSNL